MPGTTALGKLFLEKNFGRGKRRLYLLCPWLIGHVCSALIVREIIRLKPRLWSEHFIVIDDSAPVAPWGEFVFIRVRRDDCSAT